MFKYIQYPILIFVVALVSACVDYSDAVTALQLEVKIVPSADYDGDLSGHNVTITSGLATTSATTNANGIATFVGVAPNVYDVSCSWTDHAPGGNTTMAGSLSSVTVVANETLTLSVSGIRQNALIIGKIYYAGSKDSNKRNYDAGRFIEIYNNTADTAQLAGLYLGLVETESDMAYTLDQAPDTIFLKQIFRFPTSSGKQTVPPGGSVIVTNSAIDHTANADSEYDLSNADFECEDMQGSMLQNPLTHKMELIYSTYDRISYMNFINGGPSAFVIFATTDDVSAWTPVYAYQKQKGNRFVPLPTSLILDGVEILKNKSQTGPDYSVKRLYDDIDAGGAWVNAAAGRNGEVVCRKVATITDDGRIELQDTNNSTNDFATLSTSAPKVYE